MGFFSCTLLCVAIPIKIDMAPSRSPDCPIKFVSSILVYEYFIMQTLSAATVRAFFHLYVYGLVLLAKFVHNYGLYIPFFLLRLFYFLGVFLCLVYGIHFMVGNILPSHYLAFGAVKGYTPTLKRGLGG